MRLRCCRALSNCVSRSVPRPSVCVCPNQLAFCVQVLRTLPRKPEYWFLASDQRYIGLREVLANIDTVYRIQTEALTKARTRMVQGHAIRNRDSDIGKQRAQMLGTNFAEARGTCPLGLTQEERVAWRAEQSKRQRTTKAKGTEVFKEMWRRQVRFAPATPSIASRAPLSTVKILFALYLLHVVLGMTQKEPQVPLSSLCV